MKHFLTILFTLGFVIACSGQPQKEYTAEWTNKPNTVASIVATWQGDNPIDCPFYDDMPFDSLQTAGLTIDTVYTEQVSYMVTLDGKYINSIVFLAYDLSFGQGWVSVGRIGSFILKPAILPADVLHNFLN